VETIVCQWHDPGGIQGDGKHSHLERRHYRKLRACRRSPNRKSINIRPGGAGLLILRALPTQWVPRSFAFFCEWVSRSLSGFLD
jgi:hypothetical protein